LPASTVVVSQSERSTRVPVDELAASEAEAALEQALAAGADPDKIVTMAAGFIAAGYDEADSIKAAAGWYDHSEAGDELQALETISQREGWE
jgi:hypothetical protein